MGSGFKTFTTASVLTASDVNNYLMEQSVMSFASTGARDVQITAPEDGMVAYIRSNDSSEGLYSYNGTAWRKGPGWNAPWGIQAAVTSSSNTVTSGNVAGLSTTFTAIANRYYQITVSVKTSYVAAGNRALITVKDSATAINRVADYLSANATDQFHLNGSTTTTLTAGSHTIQVGWTVVAGAPVLGASAGVLHELTITDVGPSGAPV